MNIEEFGEKAKDLARELRVGVCPVSIRRYLMTEEKRRFYILEQKIFQIRLKI